MADTLEVVCAIYLPLVQSWVATPVRVTLCNSRSCYLARCTQIFEGQNFRVFMDFDLSLNIKTSKFGFNIIVGERACTVKIYS